ncbi:MAG: SDR family oxidoreductase [Flavobacteriia bacterium]|nr:SDR family oxidoreductase [Flavobacteriia bacterium]
MSSKRVLITGANGLLGQSILHANQGRFTLCATGRGEVRGDLKGAEYQVLDTTSPEDYARVFEAFKPDVVIHGAAMTQVDDCELQPALCHSLNVDATAACIEACERVGAHLIFISTDFIFDGTSGPYSEEAQAAPLSIYGQSKADAEALVQQATCPWTIARTVLVIGYVPGLSRSNIILWARGALSKGQRIKVVDDQVRSPTWSMDLAEGCLLIAEKAATGIFHLSGPDTMSILELVQHVAAHGGYDAGLIDRVSSETLGQPAKRPPITGFDISKAQKDLGFAPHTLQEVLDVIPYI